MAAEKLSLVNEIHGGAEAWTVKVKIIRLWKQNFSINPLILPSIEMVVIDEQGTRIQATVKHSLMRQYGALLEEGGGGGVRVLSRFGVWENQGTFLLTRHPFKINFNRHTGVQLSNDWAGPQQSFEPSPFNDILAMDFDSVHSFDAIGEVIHCQDTNVMNIKERETRFKCLQLQNEDGIKIMCALWDEHATKLDAFLEDSKRKDERVIMLVQFAKLGEWDRMYSTVKYFSLNSMVGSKVWINEDILAFAEFKERLFSVNANPTARRFLSSTTTYLNDDYWERFEVKNIDELMDIKQVTGCIVVATVIKIDTENGWFYHACSKCSKKVVRLYQLVDDNTEYEGIARFVCGKCNVVTDVYPKIQVQVRVQDATGCISFVIFERDITGYVDKPASQLISNATNGENSELFPPEFSVFVGKRFAWKIKVSKDNIGNKFDVYTVNKFSDDDSIIEAILKRAAGGKDRPYDVDLQVLNELPSLIGLNEKDVVFGENATIVEAMKSTASSSGLKKVVEHDDEDLDVHKMKIPKLEKF